MRMSNVLSRSFAVLLSLLELSMGRLYAGKMFRNMRHSSFNVSEFNETISTLEYCWMLIQPMEWIGEDLYSRSVDSTKEEANCGYPEELYLQQSRKVLVIYSYVVLFL